MCIHILNYYCVINININFFYIFIFHLKCQSFCNFMCFCHFIVYFALICFLFQFLSLHFFIHYLYFILFQLYFSYCKTIKRIVADSLVAVRRHIMPLHYGCPEFESPAWGPLMIPPPPLSLPLRFLSTLHCPIIIKAKRQKQIFKKTLKHTFNNFSIYYFSKGNDLFLSDMIVVFARQLVKTINNSHRFALKRKYANILATTQTTA